METLTRTNNRVMKKRMLLLLGGAMIACLLQAQDIREGEPALIYYSPKTVVVVDFTYSMEKEEPGIYARYAEAMIGADNAVTEARTVYTIEDGVLYVESDIALEGVQVQLTIDGRGKMEEVSVSEDLDGFEQASAWLSNNDYLFLAYSLNGKTLTPGKHALLHIDDAEVVSIRLSDAQGKNVNVDHNGTTGIDRMGKHVMNVNGVYDLQGRKLSSDSPLKKGIYIINGSKVVK
jgi:hypothetical protein